MQQYDSYKPSGVEWIGQIPSHWKVERLKINCTLKGRVGWKGLSSNEFKDTSYAYLVTGQDFDGSVIQWNKCYEIDKWRYDEDPYIQLQNGDLLVTKDGTIGKIAKVSDLDKPACLNSGIFVLKQRDNQFYQDYLYWTLVSSQLKDFTDYNSGGQTTIQHLYQNVFEDMPLIIPPLEEQERIAEYLDRRCAEIDDIINKEEQAIALLDELKQTIISEAVTRGLDPAVPLKPSGVDWIGNIPSHWQVRRLKHIFIGSTGVNITKSDLVDEGCPVISYGQIHSKDNPGTRIVEDLIRYIPQEKTQEKAKAEYGDFIFADTSEDLEGCGNCVWVDRETPLFAGYHTILLKCLEPIKSSYLAYLFRTDEWRDQIRSRVYGVKVYSITQSILSLTTTLFPPLEEQVRIAEYLDKRCAEIDEAKERKQRQIELLREMKQIIISDAVTGRVKVF